MADILIRDLPDHVVASIDASAQRLGLSRNEYLRRQLAQTAGVSNGSATVTAEDLARSAQAHADLLDPEVMGRAWS